MKISTSVSGVSFKRALKKEEIADYSQTLKSGKRLVGQTGKSIFIVHDACLPQSVDKNTGMGNLASKDSLKFFETMKNYLGINMIEILPQGPIKPTKGFYCAYGSSALPLGNHVINPELLLDSSFEKLITQEEFLEVVNSNKIADKLSRVNYSNVMDDNSAFDKMLAKGFERFKRLPENNGLKLRFGQYFSDNKDWLEPLSKSDKSVNPEFFAFKQFLADEHLKIAKEKLNKLGLKLCVDCEIGFSPQEVAAFPKAFKKDTYVGLPSWKLPALDYDSVLNPDSDAYKLLKRKVQLSAKRGDTIRFDVSWAYVTPQLTNVNGFSEKKEMGDSLLKLIEGWVKEVKGADFDLKDLLHEFEAAPDDFRAMVSDTELIEPLKGRTKVYSSTHLSENWGTNDAFLNYRKWSADEFVLGVGNHDPQPLRQIACDIPDVVIENGVKKELFYKKQQIEPLARILKIPKEFLAAPVEFAKAKFAEAMTAKNNMVFYMDVFGRKERFDMQHFNNPMAYSHKIPIDYEKAYINSLKEGFGFNPMDSLAKIFLCRGLDKTKPDLYNKIIKYRDILVEDDGLVKDLKQNNKILNKKFLITLASVFVICAGALYCLKSQRDDKNKSKDFNSMNTQKSVQNVQLPSAYAKFKI